LRQEKEIEAEIDMLNYLQKHGQPVSYAMQMTSGAYLTVVDAPEGVRYAVLFSEAAGKPPSLDVGECLQYGEIVANIHACMDQQPEDTRRPHLDLTQLIDEPLLYIKDFMSHRLQDFEHLQRAGDLVKSRIDGLLPKTTPEYGFCHGDHHGSNVHRDSDGKMTVFDFDCYGYGWRAYDVAIFLWQISGSQRSKVGGKEDERWEAFLEGYSKVRRLTTDELEATKLFVPIRRIWWMGIHTRLTETIGSFPWHNLAGLDITARNDWINRNVGLVREATDQS
jgi:Ser/Thr protein kinase RdoA (MazF antagonist)